MFIKYNVLIRPGYTIQKTVWIKYRMGVIKNNNNINNKEIM